MASETSCFFKKSDKVQGNEIVPANFTHALLSLLSIHDDLAMQALVSLGMVWFREIRFGTDWFSASHANLR
jgi:hypothetical protein